MIMQHGSSAPDVTAIPELRKQGRELMQTSINEVLSKDSMEKNHRFYRWKVIFDNYTV